jgi:transcriptional regulator with XRE-family HTH domain
VSTSKSLKDLGEFIRDQRNLAQMSLRRLSEIAGISNPYLSQIERGLRNPSADILKQIAKALRISAESLYIKAGFLSSDESETDLTIAILNDPKLNEEQKKSLLNLYRLFISDVN